MNPTRLAAAYVLEHVLFVAWVGARISSGAWKRVANACTAASHRVQEWAVRP